MPVSTLTRMFERFKKNTRINVVISRAKTHAQWRKENKEDLFLSRMVIRVLPVILVVVLIGALTMQTSSGAYASTWQQTNWDGGIGSSTTNQYRSALGINTSINGKFSLKDNEKVNNPSFNSNLGSWTTDKSEVAPQVISTSIRYGTNTKIHTLPLNDIPQVGNILVAVVSYHFNPGTITLPAGWVEDNMSTNTSTLGKVGIYHKVVQPGDPTTVTFNTTNTVIGSFTISEVTGIDLANPVDVTSSYNSGVSSLATVAIPSTPTTTRNNSLAFAGVAFDNTTAFTSWSSGFEDLMPVSVYGHSSVKVLSSKQSVSTTFTGNTARKNAGAIVVYNGAHTSQSNEALPGIIQSRTYTTEIDSTVIYPSVPVVGNVLVAAVSYTSNPGVVTLPAGWVEDVSPNLAVYPRVGIYHKVVQPGDPNFFTIYTTVANTTTFTIHELSGIDTSDVVDVTSVRTSGNSLTNIASMPLTAQTTNANSLALARVAFDNSSAYTSWSDGFTPTNTPLAYGYSAIKVLSSQQQVETTLNVVTARRYAGAIVVFNGAVGQTPAEVQNSTFVSSYATALSASYTKPITKGNMLLATFGTRANVGSIVPPSGWTKVADTQSAGGQSTLLYSKVAGANEPLDHVFETQYAIRGSISVYELRGIISENPVDKLSTFENISTNPLTFSLPATSVNRAFVLGAIGNSVASGFPISWANNGFTPIAGAPATEFQSAYAIQETPTPYSFSLTNASLRILQGYVAAFKAGPNYTNTTRDTSKKYSGAASAKLAASPWSNLRFTQDINVGDSENYSFSTYVYSDGGVVDGSIAKLLYNDETIATTYTSAGSGWYKLSATIVGANAVRSFGVEIPNNQTINVDDFSVNRFDSTGTLTSNIFDTGRLSDWGTLTYVKSGTGPVAVRARSSNSPTMSGAPNFNTCTPVVSGNDISSGTNGCVTDAQRYIQYQVTLDRSGELTPVFEDISISYVGSDQIPPPTTASNIRMYKTNGGASISNNGWTNANAPYFSWDAGVDNPGGIGIAGYCVYVGTDNTADPVTTKGMLGTGDLDTRNSCPFATANEYLDLGQIGVLATSFTSSNAPYYIRIKAIDANDNIYVGTPAEFSFRFDNVAPTNPSYINAPGNFIATKTATLTWPVSGGSAPADSNSGVAGLQYKIGATGKWYGDNHSGNEDFDDLLANDGSYTTQNTPDFADLIEGSNVIYFRTWDNAGNVTVGSVTTVLKINTNGAPSAPQNVTATPNTNTQNSFAFSWLAPADFIGNENNLTYCYTVNVTPTVNNCTYTNGGALNLSAGPYATQPGTNTLYVVAKDESGSINYASYGTVEFVANTAAPGVPLNLDIADTSVRSTQNWRLVIGWESPIDVGAGVSSYQIYRSTNGNDWSKVGSTGGTSYVDTGLDQVNYIYKVKACDSANNCGAFSSLVNQTPTGRFTTPAHITSSGGTPVVSNIKTRSVDISWSTDRNSDSKVAFGTVSGVYGATEAYKSQQTTDHKITLDSLSPGVTYFFVARWTDTDGNTGSTTELAFTTLPPPVVQDVSAIGISLTGATIQYTTTGASKVKIYYGQTNGFGAVISSDVSTSKSTYLAQLNDLRDGTKYYYKVNTFDSSGFEYDGTTLSFDTPPAPRISNLRFQPVEGEKSSTQLITWDTNVPATSELSYAQVGGETLTALDTTLVTSHALTIRNLVDDSEYRLTARSRDVASNLATSDVQSFRTALDTRPPEVSEVVVIASIRGTGADARGQIIVSWKTDEPATSQVAYGEGSSGSLGNSSTQDARLTYDHAVVISDLSTSKVYSVQAISYDKGNNKAVSEKQSAIIGRGTQSALGIIFSVLQKIFGVGM